MPRRRLLLALLLLPLPAVAQAPVGGNRPPPPPLPPLPQIALTRGIVALTPESWRVEFLPDRDVLEVGQRVVLGRIGAALNTGSVGRITLVSEVGSGDDLSTTRRLSLVRARAVKAALVAGGLAETRVDIRALGHTIAQRDSVDILTPTAPRP
ncbi:MAG: hypothetical protein JWR10_1250 [Rubritepida sp.]|nr:hypothetical protein [Rubritepida sp.]